MYKIVITILFIPLLGNAQNWAAAYSLGSSLNESLDAFAPLDDGRWVLGGTYQNQLPLTDTTLMTKGEEDIFCIVQKGGQTDIALSFGSTRSDKISGISTYQNHINLFGTYTRQIVFDTDTLTSSLSSKGLFITQYDTLGNLRWTQSIDANILSISGAIQTNDLGQIAITGYFYNQFIIQKDTLTAQSTEGDAFIALLDDDGNLLWLKQAGNSGITRSTELAFDTQNNLIVAGQFKGTSIFGNDTLQTLTADHDVFICKMNPKGEFLWAKKLGGVHEGQVATLTVGDNDNIYLAGNFIGVLSDYEDWNIQTSGINNNIFLVELSPQGTINWGQNLGGTDEDIATNISIQNEKIALASYFQNQTIFGQDTLYAQGTIDAQISIFNTQGTLLNVIPISGKGLDIIQFIKWNEEGSLSVAGIFNDELPLGENTLETQGKFDVFWAKTSTTVHNIDVFAHPKIRIYPNPASDFIINTSKKQLEIYNLQGLKIVSSRESLIDIRHIPNGMYVVSVDNQFTQIIVQH